MTGSAGFPAGLDVGANGSTVRALAIVGGATNLINVSATGVVVGGDFLGGVTLNSTGTAINAQLSATGLTVGGAANSERNVMATNDGLNIQNNYLSLNAAGTVALGSPQQAIEVQAGNNVQINGNVIGNWAGRFVFRQCASVPSASMRVAAVVRAHCTCAISHP